MATGRLLLVICLTTASWSISFGLSSQVISHWLHFHGADNTQIGLNHSTYYLGLALASLTVPWLRKRLGNSCIVKGMILSALTLALFPWAGSWAGWFILRFLNGTAGAMCLVPLEILISRGSQPEQRSRNFGFYGVALTLGGALGIWAGLHFYRPGESLTFYLGALFPAAAGLVLVRLLPVIAPELPVPLPKESIVWSRHFLCYGTAWFQGFLEGGLLAFLSLYLLALGMSPDGAGGLMGVTMVGVILFQVPVAWLADRLGRLPVLLGCYAVVALGLALMPMWSPSAWLVICLFLLGASSGALYPLALAMLGDRLSPAALPRAYALFMAMECVGSQIGAAVMGQARDWWGEGSMFGVGLAALATILGCWAVLMVGQRRGARIKMEKSRLAA